MGTVGFILVFLSGLIVALCMGRATAIMWNDDIVSRVAGIAVCLCGAGLMVVGFWGAVASMGT